MNKSSCSFSCPVNKHLFPPTVGWLVCDSPGSCANNIYSPGSYKLTEVQVFMSTSCQPGSRVIRAFSDVEKPFLFSVLVVKAAKSENKYNVQGFSTSEKAQISS